MGQHLIEFSFPLIALQWNINISVCHVINIASCIGQTGIAAWMNKSVRNYEKWFSFIDKVGQLGNILNNIRDEKKKSSKYKKYN